MGGDGRLNCQELHVFAGYIGFDRSDEEWGQEYNSLLQEKCADPAVGVDLQIFTMLVEDASESGCYCTDKELATMVGRLESIPYNSAGSDQPRENVEVESSADPGLGGSSQSVFPEFRPPPGLEHLVPSVAPAHFG